MRWRLQGQYLREVQTRKVDLSKDNPDIVHAMLHYLYHFNYNDVDVDEHGSVSRMPFNIRVFVIAHEYDIKPLKTYARERFSDSANQEPKGSGFSSAAKLLYEGTSDSGSQERKLREEVVCYARVHYAAPERGS
ncbi:MAG: hypothetical protein M1822_006992 [Bathelium mastoideum]|nr:MAG: hypothetical protein M1822_006992 [Bathelium mastoideum]